MSFRIQRPSSATSAALAASSSASDLLRGGGGGGATTPLSNHTCLQRIARYACRGLRDICTFAAVDTTFSDVMLYSAPLVLRRFQQIRNDISAGKPYRDQGRVRVPTIQMVCDDAVERDIDWVVAHLVLYCRRDQLPLGLLVGPDARQAAGQACVVTSKMPPLVRIAWLGAHRVLRLLADITTVMRSPLFAPELYASVPTARLAQAVEKERRRIVADAAASRAAARAAAAAAGAETHAEDAEEDEIERLRAFRELLLESEAREQERAGESEAASSLLGFTFQQLAQQMVDAMSGKYTEVPVLPHFHHGTAVTTAENDRPRRVAPVGTCNVPLSILGCAILNNRHEALRELLRVCELRTLERELHSDPLDGGGDAKPFDVHAIMHDNSNNNLDVHFAAARDATECLRVLVEHGASLAAINRMGCTPLHLACSNNNAAMIRYIVEQVRQNDGGDGSSPSRTPMRAVPADYLLKKNAGGHSPRACARMGGCAKDILELLPVPDAAPASALPPRQSPMKQ